MESFTSTLMIVQAAAVHAGTSHVPPQLDKLMLFGFMSAVGTLVCWHHVQYSRAMRLMLGICLLAMAVYSFLFGAWPAGLVLLVTSAATIYRWWAYRKAGGNDAGPAKRRWVPSSGVSVAGGARVIALFGSSDLEHRSTEIPSDSIRHSGNN